MCTCYNNYSRTEKEKVEWFSSSFSPFWSSLVRTHVSRRVLPFIRISLSPLPPPHSGFYRPVDRTRWRCRELQTDNFALRAVHACLFVPAKNNTLLAATITIIIIHVFILCFYTIHMVVFEHLLVNYGTRVRNILCCTARIDITHVCFAVSLYTHCTNLHPRYNNIVITCYRSVRGKTYIYSLVTSEFIISTGAEIYSKFVFRML